MEEQIKKEIESFMVEQFNINVDKIGENDNFYLLGMKPRDVVNLVFMLEEKYNIHFSEAELAENKFDSITNIILTIKRHMDT